MWSWRHFQQEGWLSHTKRSLRLTILLLLGSIAMLVHTIVPFWQQPKFLRAGEISLSLKEMIENHKERLRRRNIKM